MQQQRPATVQNGCAGTKAVELLIPLKLSYRPVLLYLTGDVGGGGGGGDSKPMLKQKCQVGQEPNLC